MLAEYRNIRVLADGSSLRVLAELTNRTEQTWTPGNFSLGWQFFDPETNLFICEGAWTPVDRDVKPGAGASFSIDIPFPPESAGYRIFVSPIQQPQGWAYHQGEPFVIIGARISGGTARVLSQEITTTRALRWRRLRRAVPKFFQAPWRTLVENHRLIRSMARRDVLARYRGSIGDAFWSVLNPLLLIATYAFVFGFVLRTRFAADQTSTGFVVYFLAGMLPWLAFSEPVGRSPHVIPEHRNFVKKLIFPLETLPVIQVLSGLVTEFFGMVLFLLLLLAVRHALPLSLLWLPALLAPQVLFTVGLCWFLAALGVFVRDLGQILGFLMTFWFFATPICYPEASLPAGALVILRKNPLYVIVRGYRAVLLEGHRPDLLPLLKLWVVASAMFLLGYAWFYKLRKNFADVI